MPRDASNRRRADEIVPQRHLRSARP
jgi:hypothetical protein